MAEDLQPLSSLKANIWLVLRGFQEHSWGLAAIGLLPLGAAVALILAGLTSNGRDGCEAAYLLITSVFRKW